MKVTWLGHSCFRVEADGKSVICDPYSPGSVPGLKPVAVSADGVTCSHGHGDHCYADGVSLTGAALPFTVTTVDCFHDEAGGSQRGENRIHIFDLPDGLRAVHLGDLGHMLSPEQLAAVGKPDVLMIPVGGFFTIDARTAKELCDALQPRVIIPMHFRSAAFGYDIIAPVEDFTALFDPSRVTILPDSELTVTADTVPGVRVLTPALPEG